MAATGLAMNSNTHCFPITNTEVIREILANPPDWIKRIKPLRKRSASVLENKLVDCHVDYEHFKVRERCDSRTVPKTLVCHDYKGGYKEDRFLYGDDSDVAGNSYTFYNWPQIDIFVYFSHYFITIPPVSWINAAHSHGVKVLGTFITEFKDGEKLCKELFKNYETMRELASDLAEISKTFKFDGWLLNIENPIENMDHLQTFVSLLTFLVHDKDPDSLVIWYDAVAVDGKLSHQNELNSMNETFFNSCDGIFLNYVWNEVKLINTSELAKHRTFDVYVGIDVFGRNTFGGGHFNCYKAAEIIRKYNLSMAIFAPGWTHETLSEPYNTFFDAFVNRDTAFWKSLYPYMYTHPTTEIFKTNFHLGLDTDNFNLFKQNHQLSLVTHPEDLAKIPQVTDILPLKNICNCIQTVVKDKTKTYLLTNSNLRRNTPYVHNLFSCDIKMKGNTLIYFIAKRDDTTSSARLSVTLLTSTSSSFKKIKLLSTPREGLLKNMSVLEVNPSMNEELIKDIASQYTQILVLPESFLSVYALHLEPCEILEIGASVENGSSIHLCAFGIQEENNRLRPYLFNN